MNTLKIPINPIGLGVRRTILWPCLCCLARVSEFQCSDSRNRQRTGRFRRQVNSPQCSIQDEIAWETVTLVCVGQILPGMLAVIRARCVLSVSGAWRLCVVGLAQVHP